MNSADVLIDSFERVAQDVAAVLDGLDDQTLSARVTADANTIAWLIWHLTRVQDDHIADVAGEEQLWTSQGFAKRFDLSFPHGDTGYGHSSEHVAKVRVSAELLGEYFDAVHARTKTYLATLSDADLERVVDDRWDPPVTLGVRLVSILNDDAQHVGQAAYVRGLLGA
jgi:uncharacterized damage-inducible protein DinB